MMRKSFIIIIISLIFASCTKNEEFELIYKVNIQNNTSFNVNMQLIKINDSTILSNYFCPPNSYAIVDTVIYSEYSFRKPVGLIYGEGFAASPYWNSNSVRLKYVFEDNKETVLQNAYGGICDTTLNAIFICSYAERVFDTISLDKKTTQYIETITYFVTQQQRHNAK